MHLAAIVAAGQWGNAPWRVDKVVCWTNLVPVMNTSNTASNTDQQPTPAWQARLGAGAAVLLGSVLIFGALTKVAAPQSFVATVESFGLLPSRAALAMSTALIGSEFALGLLLVTGLFRRVAAWLNLMVMMVFVAVLSDAIRTGRTEDCGCFGEAIKMTPKQEIFVDVVLIALTFLVVWRGRDRVFGTPAQRHGLAWGAFVVGCAAFLLSGPTPVGVASIEMDEEQLLALSRAEPPLALPEDGLLYLFSADCDHCWAYAGGVQMAHDRLGNFTVVGLTFSEDHAIEEFREFFTPSYPIHRISEAAFNKLTDEYPGAIWIHGGQIGGAWSGFVPSHRELADLGGYLLVEAAASPTLNTLEAPTTKSRGDLFGGTASSRH